MENWDEVRTAGAVARLGTVSGAAEALGVHHATVIRHVDALERSLGVRLFQRHARGYTPTEAGHDLLQVVQATQDQFSQLEARLRGHGDAVSGEVIVTTIPGTGPLLAPVIAGFRDAHPGVSLRVIADHRLFRLEFGEAHVALRAGTVPQEPDNVVQPLAEMTFGLYASQSYVAAHGLPRDAEDTEGHRYIGAEGTGARAPFQRWLERHVPASQVVLRVSAPEDNLPYVAAGIGIGFVWSAAAERLPELVAIPGTRAEWLSPLWIVTHVDLHRTAKVQAFVAALKAGARDWGAV